MLAIPNVLTIDHIIPLGYPDEETEKKTARMLPVKEGARQSRFFSELVR